MWVRMIDCCWLWRISFDEANEGRREKEQEIKKLKERNMKAKKKTRTLRDHSF